MHFRVADIIRGTTVDGPGFRTSIYLAGCSHHCPGCQNPQTWDPEAGTDMTLDEIMDIVREEDFNVTLSGGDPFFNPEKLTILAQSIKNAGYTLWVYTGYTWDQLTTDEGLRAPLEFIDTVVDGRFIQSLRNPDLPFRGSSNQRIIDVREALRGLSD